jgi:hypothetical protein
VFVESKDGVLPLLGVSPLTPISAVKHLLEALTGISVSQQLLSSVGRVMHDEFLVRDFDGLHRIYEDSIIDLCKSGMTKLGREFYRANELPMPMPSACQDSNGAKWEPWMQRTRTPTKHTGAWWFASMLSAKRNSPSPSKDATLSCRFLELWSRVLGFHRTSRRSVIQVCNFSEDLPV